MHQPFFASLAALTIAVCSANPAAARDLDTSGNHSNSVTANSRANYDTDSHSTGSRRGTTTGTVGVTTGGRLSGSTGASTANDDTAANRTGGTTRDSGSYMGRDAADVDVGTSTGVGVSSGSNNGSR